jgi:hypothetical protein
MSSGVSLNMEIIMLSYFSAHFRIRNDFKPLIIRNIIRALLVIIFTDLIVYDITGITLEFFYKSCAHPHLLGGAP